MNQDGKHARKGSELALAACTPTAKPVQASELTHGSDLRDGSGWAQCLTKGFGIMVATHHSSSLAARRKATLEIVVRILDGPCLGGGGGGGGLGRGSTPDAGGGVWGKGLAPTVHTNLKK